MDSFTIIMGYVLALLIAGLGITLKIALGDIAAAIREIKK